MREALLDKPQGFNSPLGFDLVTLLDDASRNAALTAAATSIQVVKSLSEGKAAGSSPLVQLTQNAYDTSTLIYTVSESAAAMYLKFVDWEDDVLREALAMLDEFNKAAGGDKQRK